MYTCQNNKTRHLVYSKYEFNLKSCLPDVAGSSVIEMLSTFMSDITDYTETENLQHSLNK